jgi:hypothetical protein
MGLSMSYDCVQIQALECKLCGSLIDDERVRSTRVGVTLFGAKAYAVCPCCLQPYEGKIDARWRGKVDRWLAKRAKENPDVDQV